jgi:hypothetical protein
MLQKQSEIFEQLEGTNIKFYFNTAICLNMSSNVQAKSAAFTHLTKKRFLSIIENTGFSSVTSWNTWVYCVHLKQCKYEYKKQHRANVSSSEEHDALDAENNNTNNNNNNNNNKIFQCLTMYNFKVGYCATIIRTRIFHCYLTFLIFHKME